MSDEWSYKYALSSLQHLLLGSRLAGAEQQRLLERAQTVFRSLNPYRPTYLRQQLTDSGSFYFSAYLRTRLLAEIEIHPGLEAANPATIYLRLLDGGQYVLQQEMPHGELAGRLALYFVAEQE
jgi:hypothetical protein